MPTSTCSAMEPCSEPLPFPLPTEEETCKYMQYFSDSLSMRIHNTAVVKPEDLGKMMANFQMIGSGFVDFLCKEYNKLHEKYAIDVKKLVDEKMDLESVIEALNREMEEFRGLNSKLNCENEEVHGLYLKLSHEMEELRGRSSKVSIRLVELGGEIEVAREESDFLRSKNKRLCSEVELARVENKRLQGLVDGFGAKEHAIKLEGVNEFASGPRFFKRFAHFASQGLKHAGQMGVGQMAKIYGVPSVPFKMVPSYIFHSAGPYTIPKLGEVELDNEKTLEAWDVTQLNVPQKNRIPGVGLRAKRKANDLVVQPASRPRTDDPTS